MVKSKTAWGGVGQWLLTAVLAALASGQPLFVWFGVDKASAQGIRLDAPVLFAVATALLGLVLWGRKTARGPLGEAGTEAAQQYGSLLKDFQRHVEQATPAYPASPQPLTTSADVAAAVFGPAALRWPEQRSAADPKLKIEGKTLEQGATS
ncbi:hypothetical protein NY78_0475 [Desulfovibrio sp. TomC]|nr:hypothetical protein NY78_0475 [Desulfovibrio sp. TomC]